MGLSESAYKPKYSDVEYRLMHNAAVENLGRLRIQVNDRSCRTPLLACEPCGYVRRFAAIGQRGHKVANGQYVRFDHVYRCTHCHGRREWGYTVERDPGLEVLSSKPWGIR